MRRKKLCCGIFCILVLLFGACGEKTEVYLEEHVTESKESVLSEVVTEQEETSKSCCVYICGAVVFPGVYELPEGSRIYEVIELAGGLTEEADADFLNQAAQITDGQMIRIYTYQEVKDGVNEEQVQSVSNAVSDNKVNLNTADKTELMTLPGVGSSKADAILAYRKEHGSFKSVEELMNIAGIKEGVFLQIKEQVKVED